MQIHTHTHTLLIHTHTHTHKPHPASFLRSTTAIPQRLSLHIFTSKSPWLLGCLSGAGGTALLFCCCHFCASSPSRKQVSFSASLAPQSFGDCVCVWVCVCVCSCACVCVCV